jgi:hypothetical protein
MSVLAPAREMVSNDRARLAATIAKVRVGPRMSPAQFERYEEALRSTRRADSGPDTSSAALGATSAPAGVLSGEVPDGPAGALVSVTVVAHGLRGRIIAICWALFRTRERVAMTVVTFGGCVAVMRPEADVQRETTDLWVPVSRGGGSWLMRISLRWRVHPLDYADVRTFP